jgi:hypothetical protein
MPETRQDSAPSAVPLWGIALSYLRVDPGSTRASTEPPRFLKTRICRLSKVGKTLWLSSLPYPFNAFFSSLKKRQSVLLITAIM